MLRDGIIGIQDRLALSWPCPRLPSRVPVEVGLLLQTGHRSLLPWIYRSALLLALLHPSHAALDPSRRDNLPAVPPRTKHSPTMCFVGRTSRPLATSATATHHAGCKRSRPEMTTTLALYDPSAAADQQQAEDAGALVPFVASREPIDAVPLSAVAPPKKLAPDAVVRAEPPWLRTGLLPHLRFRSDLPVRFIDEKAVTATDLVPHQNRFRLPSEGVMCNLRPMLSPLERKAANLLHEEAAPRPPRLPKLPKVPGEKAKKRKGKEHGGLPVLVVEPSAGVRELQLVRWDSSGGTVIKGDGYLDFINSCGFKVDDVVQIWAFKETYFRLFGEDLCRQSPLYLLITKKGQMLPG